MNYRFNVVLLSLSLFYSACNASIATLLPVLGYGALGGSLTGISRILKHYCNSQEKTPTNPNQQQDQEETVQSGAEPSLPYYTASLGKNVLAGVIGILVAAWLTGTTHSPKDPYFPIMLTASGMLFAYFFGHEPNYAKCRPKLIIESKNTVKGEEESKWNFSVNSR